MLRALVTATVLWFLKDKLPVDQAAKVLVDGMLGVHSAASQLSAGDFALLKLRYALLYAMQVDTGHKTALELSRAVGCRAAAAALRELGVPVRRAAVVSCRADAAAACSCPAARWSLRRSSRSPRCSRV